MELNQDWRKLQSVLQGSRVASEAPGGAIYCLVEANAVVQVFSEREDLSEWVGAPLEELRSQFSTRTIVEWDRRTMEASLLSSLGEPHLEAQISRWRTDATEQAVLSAGGESRSSARGKKEQAFRQQALAPQRHFLIDSLKDSWWTRVLPSSYGILLRFEGGSESLRSSRDFLLVYRKGKLEQFGNPDLNFMGADRRKDPAEVVKYLGERLMVPVQAVLFREEDWNRWSQEAHPWREIAWAIQSNRVQLVPFRWSVVSLLASRGLLNF